MKLKTLTIKNVGLIADTVIQLDKPLLLFYGEIRQGKTTILNVLAGLEEASAETTRRPTASGPTAGWPHSPPG